MTAQRGGYVLAAALWIVILISAAGLHAAASVRYKRLYSRNLLDGEHGRAAAFSALARTRAELSRLLTTTTVGPYDPWYAAVDAIHKAGDVGAWRYEISATDAESLLNINTAPRDQLERFFRALNVERPQQSAAVIVAARERTGGFHEIAELAEADSSLSRAYGILQPLITVSGAGRINLNTAPHPVLLSLPGVSTRAADLIIDMQADHQRIHSSFQIINALSGDDRMQMAEVLPDIERLITVETRTLLVTVETTSAGAVVRARARAEFGRQGTTARLNSVEWI